MNTKRILILFIASFSMQLLSAQGSKVSSAYFLMDDYNNDKTVESLQKAKKAIDEAVVHETTSLQGKAWYYRGLIYNMLSKDETTKSADANYTSEAVKSFEKALTIEDKRFRDDKKVVLNLQDIAVNTFNSAIESHQGKDFKKAYNSYTEVGKIREILKANGSNLTFEYNAVLKNLTFAAEDGGMLEEAIVGYNKLIESDPKDAYFFNLAKLYKKNENEEMYLATLDRGAEANPDNANIIIEQLNYLMKAGKKEAAMGKIDKAIELQPDNHVLYFVKAKTYDDDGDKENAIKFYNEALEVNPKYTDALFNIGAIYFLAGNPIVEKMNELTTSPADTKIYNGLVEERKVTYRKAKVYFEQILEMEPDNAGAQKTIDKINRVLDK